MDTIESLTAEIRALEVQEKLLRRNIRDKAKKRDGLMLEANKEHFGDIEWLINNPTTPGQGEALMAWVTDRFGGEWMGVYPSGYYPEISQQAFDILLHDRWVDKNDQNSLAKRIENVHAFFAECLGYFRPNDDGFVSFTYATGKHSGIFQLSYRPSNQTWWTTNTRYGRMVSKTKRKNLDDAIAHALWVAPRVDD